MTTTALRNPFELMQISLEEPVVVRAQNFHTIVGVLVGFDGAMNVMLQDAKSYERDPETGKFSVTDKAMYWVRGSHILAVAPLSTSKAAIQKLVEA